MRVDTRKAAPLSGSISAAFSVLEVFAGLLSAACHDYDHPGRTNAFLTATKNPLVRVDGSILGGWAGILVYLVGVVVGGAVLDGWCGGWCYVGWVWW